MLIEVGYAYAKVQASDAEKKWLDGFLSVECPKARFSTAYKTGRWDGRERLYRWGSSTIPAGAAALVRHYGTAAGLTVELVDSRRCPVIPKSPTSVAPWLRDYQLEAVRTAIRQTRGVIWVPTGGGKTILAAGLSVCVNAPTLFLVDAKDLLHQTVEKYQAFTGEEAGLIGEGSWNPRQFTVATVQTLARGLKTPRVLEFLAGLVMVIGDEIHKSAAKTVYRTLMAIPKAYFRYGLSGTPLQRSDGRGLYVIAATGPVIYKLPAETAVEEGILARPIVRFVTYRGDKFSCAPVTGSWQAIYYKGITANDGRNHLLCAIADYAEKPCLVSVERIEHGQRLYEMLSAMGWRVEFVWGADSGVGRLGAVDRLRKGKTQIIVSSKVFGVGIDIPELRSVVNASGGQAAIPVIQRIGRGMRRVDGKQDFQVFDLKDEHNFTLRKHSVARMKTVRDVGYDVAEISAADLMGKEN